MFEGGAGQDVVKIDLASGTGSVSFAAGYAGNVDAVVTGDFDGVAGTETLRIVFIGGNGVCASDFLFV